MAPEVNDSRPASAHMPVVSDLYVYPIKSCGGIRLESADLWETGLYLDRLWMVVTDDGQFVSQRTAPRLALVRTALKFESLQVRAPGMLRLDIPIAGFDYSDARRVDVEVWGNRIEAFPENALVNTWFSRFLELSVRLVRIDPDFRRICDPRWTGSDEAITQFADGFPLLIIAKGSLDDLNRRLQAAGKEPVPMERFRPNVVIDDIDPYGEDYLASIGTEDYEFRLVKPCARCTIPCVDQETAIVGTEPLDALTAYRQDQRVGGVTFGMNAIVVRGADEAVVKVGDSLQAQVDFA
jgi:uncharacterized protein YcbX